MTNCQDTEGTVDIVSFIRPLDTLKVAGSKYAKVVKSRDISTLGGYFNQRKRGSKWRDIRLRKALNYAINRKELLRYCAKGNARNLGGFIPPGAYGHNPELILFTYDTTKARLLLSEAGYPNGFEMNIITLEAYGLEAQIISKMLERIGLRVTLDVLPYTGFLRRTYMPLLNKPPEQQDWDLAILAWTDWLGHTAMPFVGYGFLEEMDERWTEFDTTYENMFKDMAATINPEKQEAKIQQMVKYIYDRAQALFIYSPYNLYAINREVDFVPQKSLWLRLKETSVTKNHWSLRGKSN
jgi:peptide/nickel transport system substrate-binding protein